MNQRYKRESNKAAMVYLATLALAVIAVLLFGRGLMFLLLILVNVGAFYWSCLAYIRAKGRSDAWLLAPLLLFVFGVLILLALKDLSPPSSTRADLPEWAQ